MSDIFVSYASEDRDRILPLVNALEKTEWSIFWDRTIPAGKTWREVIGGEIQSARCVVVIWTGTSIKSRWVQEEADVGVRRKILVPILFDEVEPPFGFGSIQAANMVAWNGDTSSPVFTRLIADISAVKDAEESRVLEAESRRNIAGKGILQKDQATSQGKLPREAEEKNRKRIKQEPKRSRPRKEKIILSEGDEAKKEPSVAPRSEEQQRWWLSQRLTWLNRRQVYVGGVVLIVAFAAAVALWTLRNRESLGTADLVNSSDADSTPALNLSIGSFRPGFPLSVVRVYNPG